MATFLTLLLSWTICKIQIVNLELRWFKCTKFYEHTRRVSFLFVCVCVAFTRCHAPHNHIILFADRLHLCCTFTASTTSFLFPSNCGKIVGVSRGLLVSLTRVSRSNRHANGCMRTVCAYAQFLMHKSVSAFFLSRTSNEGHLNTVMLTKMLLMTIQRSLLAARWDSS